MFGKLSLLFIIWIGITNSLEIQELIVGVVVCFFVVYFFIDRDEDFHLLKRLKTYLLFIPLFLKELIKSNIEVAKIVLSKEIKIESKIVTLQTNLKNDHDKLLLSNSITLTPGTLTLDVQGDVLKVHILDARGKDENYFQENTIAQFEKAIAK